MKKLFLVVTMLLSMLMLSACGKRVEVPPAHVGKIMTKDGYQKANIPPSKFRLAACLNYCDKLVLLDTSDRAKMESMTIFMPEDKLNLNIGIQVTLSLDQNETSALFTTLPPQEVAKDDPNVSKISWDQIYNTYAQQIVLTETREYMSRYSIATVSSSLQKVNSDLRDILAKRIQERTPFNVRYVGITTITYPKIITDAQENAAERRERIQSEEAQLEISKVTLQRELQETQLRRQIDLEKAQIEAKSQEIQAATIDSRVLELRRIQNEGAWIRKWNGQLPTTVMGEKANVLMQVPSK